VFGLVVAVRYFGRRGSLLRLPRLSSAPFLPPKELITGLDKGRLRIGAGNKEQAIARRTGYIRLVRIIGGMAGGRRLRVPGGTAVRPTPDLVRQAVFNSLAARIAGARVLELFAGTGALSLECLSRGAAHATCVELSSRHAGFVRENLRTTGLAGETLDVRVQDAFVAIRQLAAQGAVFDLVFADPPYGEKNLKKRSESFAQRLLDDAHLPGLVAADGLLVLGHARRDTLALPDGVWRERKCLRHGDSVMRMLEHAERRECEMRNEE